jgi:hypothetical protein
MSSSSNETVFIQLQEQYGEQLYRFTYEQKIVIRAALAGFIAQKPVWQSSNSGITCMQSCIESAGVDWNIWDKDPELCEFIEACDRLEDSNIEGLIAALSEQIRYRH